jgi:hypothetical protein
MSTADSYRKIAAELKARAAKERSADVASELDNLARCYLRLASQADTNSDLDVSVEFGPKPTMGGEDGGA